MEAHLGGPLGNAGTDLEHLEPHGLQPQGRHAGLVKLGAQDVQQPVRGHGEEQTELVGPEVMAAQAGGMTGGFELIDPLLRLTALHVPIIERQRRVGAAGDHEAGVEPFRQRFGLEYDVALAVPAVCLVACLSTQADLDPRSAARHRTWPGAAAVS